MPDQRPVHHITPERGWLNDPNGLIHRDGRYHVFHQANPHAVTWGTMEWGHVSSPDLVHWTRHATAFAASPGPDAGGCWSGCIVVDDDVPTAVYTGVERLESGDVTQTLCLARGDAGLHGWRKDPANPVLPGPPEGLSTIGFRDPFVWREGDAWSMVIGCGLTTGDGTILLFSSPDLVEWRCEGPIMSRNASDKEPIWTGRMWECPQFLPVGGKHLLVFSVWDDKRPPTLHYPVATIGAFDGRTFTPGSWTRFDFGADCYAPALMQAPDGRILAWGWSWEALSDRAREAQGWAGSLTLPRVVSERKDGGFAVELAEEVAALRGASVEAGGSELPDGLTRLPRPPSADVVDIAARFAVGDAARVGLMVRRSPDGAEQTSISWDAERQWLEIDRTCSSLSNDARRSKDGGPLRLSPGEPLDLRVVVDRSIVEVFANGRVAITERIYPTRDDSIGIGAFADGRGATLEQFAAWELPG
jgi:beta-fructofuranosidase